MGGGVGRSGAGTQGHGHTDNGWVVSVLLA